MRWVARLSRRESARLSQSQSHVSGLFWALRCRSTGFAAALAAQDDGDIHGRDGGEDHQDDDQRRAVRHDKTGHGAGRTHHEAKAGEDQPKGERAVGRRCPAEARGRIVVVGQATTESG
jgi:hypothetical protein